MIAKFDNEPKERGKKAGAENGHPEGLDEFWKEYIGIVGGDGDPNYGNYRASASERGEAFADSVVEQYHRQQEEFARYLRAQEQQQQ